MKVYLDSSDFSRLSNSKRSADEAGIGAQLQAWATLGEVQFAFSGAHLTEMAPLEASFTPAAAARTDLVVGLCGRNALMSFDRLVVAELKCLQGLEPPPEVVSTEAEWYPDWGTLVSPVEWVNAIGQVDASTKEHGFNRQQRRLVKRKMFKHGRPKQATRSLLLDNEQGSDYKELLELYPMRLQDARVLGSYFLGAASADEANEAFLESLRDPRWMMSWFARHHDKLTPFTEWLRAPAQNMLESIQSMAGAAQQLHELQRILGPAYKPKILSAEGWARQQDEMVRNVAQRTLLHFSPDSQAPVTVQQVDAYCPGLSTFVRSVHSAARDSMSETPRQAKASDFADGVHAMYAPYVDIFRADSYMAAHVQRCVTRRGTTVVPKLVALVPALKARLAASG